MKKVVTVTLGSSDQDFEFQTSFLGQAKSGLLSCLARRRGGGKTIFVATGEVLDAGGKLIALGEGTFRYIAETPR